MKIKCCSKNCPKCPFRNESEFGMTCNLHDNFLGKTLEITIKVNGKNPRIIFKAKPFKPIPYTEEMERAEKAIGKIL